MANAFDVRKSTILIIDDDSISRSYLRSSLQSMDCENILEASKAIKAIEICERHRPDIIFLDIDLDGTDGIDIIKDLSEHLNEHYIVMVSAHGTVENVKRAIDNGARGFIVKPFTIGKVQQAMDGAMKHLKTQDQVTLEVPARQDGASLDTAEPTNDQADNGASS